MVSNIAKQIGNQVSAMYAADKCEVAGIILSSTRQDFSIAFEAGAELNPSTSPDLVHELDQYSKVAEHQVDEAAFIIGLSLGFCRARRVFQKENRDV